MAFVHAGLFGTLGQGPFSKLIEPLNAIGWGIDLPYAWTRAGLRNDLLSAHSKLLLQLLRDDWLQWVATQVNSCKAMTALKGVDERILDQSRKGQTAPQLSL